MYNLLACIALLDYCKVSNVYKDCAIVLSQVVPARSGVSTFTDEGVSAMNGPVYALFDEHFHVDSFSLSIVAFKAIAATIFH